jgi:diketogulonate reductase-like aldo/keto reductase
MPTPQVPILTAHGVEMPAIGCGTLFPEPEPETAAPLVAAAIEYGYRHIDTARKYGSEEAVGEGIRASGIAREELFITTKVTEEDATADAFARSVDTSLKAIGVDYVDLLLIHWHQPKVPLSETLGALAKAKRDGLARHVGVSNFTVALLDEAHKLTTEPLVANQIEYHAYIRQDKVLAACRKYGMIVTAHVPLARGKIVDDPVIGEIAQAKGKTTAQVALRWLVQQPDISVVPRTTTRERLAENIAIFDFSLTDEEMDRISALRDTNIRVVDPAVRRPVWDVG